MADLPDVKLRGLVNFPVRVTGGTAIDIEKEGGAYTIALDVSGLVKNPAISAGEVAQSWMTIWNETLDAYQNVPYALAATAGVASVGGKTGALAIGDGLQFTGSTLELLTGNGLQFTGSTLELLPSNVIYMTGLSPTGDNGPALNAALAALPTGDNGGGRIKLPLGTCTFSTPINMDGLVNVIVEGVGSRTSGADTGTKLRYTGSGSGDAISMRGANVGCGFRDMKIAYNNPAFDGNLVNIGNGAPGNNSQQAFDNVVFADDGAAHLACLVYLGGGSQVVTFDRCTFNGGKPSVKGKDAADSDHFANVIAFRDCTFLAHSGPGVRYGGVSWTFENCAIEPDATGASIFYRGDPTVPAQGVVFDNCFIGDATAAGEWIFFYGTGFVARGGTIGADHSGSQYGIVLHAATGNSITGVTFGSLATAVSLDDSAVDATVVKGNTFITCDLAVAKYAFRGGAVVCEANSPRTDLDPAFGSTTWNPASLINGAQTSTTLTVTGAVAGDRVEVSFDVPLQSLSLHGYVNATDTVAVVLQNQTGGTVDLASGTLRVRVVKW